MKNSGRHSGNGALADRISEACGICPTPVRELKDIPAKGYMVYVLGIRGKAVAVGVGQRNRAKILFDSVSQVTSTHRKSLPVRALILSGEASSEVERFIIPFDTRADAVKAEKSLHTKIGGNKAEISDPVLNWLLKDHKPNSRAWVMLMCAVHTGFDGLSDLTRWRKAGIIDDPTWEQIVDRLKLASVPGKRFSRCELINPDSP